MEFFQEVGPAFNSKGELVTETTTKISQYLTYMGPLVARHCVFPAQTPNNLRTALYRMQNVRKPLEVGLHWKCCANQIKNFTLLPHHIFNFMHPKLSCSDTMGTLDAMQFVADTHSQKRKLYQHYYELIVDYGLRVNKNEMNEVNVKAELAKAFKAARAFVNLGVGTTLPLSDLLKRMKHILADGSNEGRIECENGYVQFIPKPTRSNMTKWARALKNPTSYAAFVHSDDGSLIIDQAKSFNIDISGADRSHGPAAFAMFGTLFLNHEEEFLEGLESIFRPLKLKLKGHQLWGFLYPLLPYLPSGHVFTTLINSWVLALLMAEFISRSVTTSDEIYNIGIEYGYILTVDEDFPMLLKKSPHPILTTCPSRIGILFRAMGKCEGDMVGSGHWKERAWTYLYNLLCCFTSDHTSPIFETWKERAHSMLTTNSKTSVAISGVMQSKFEYKGLDLTIEAVMLQDKDWFYPYEELGLSLQSGVQALQQLSQMNPGEHFWNATTALILKADYGQQSPDSYHYVSQDRPGSDPTALYVTPRR